MAKINDLRGLWAEVHRRAELQAKRRYYELAGQLWGACYERLGDQPSVDAAIARLVVHRGELSLAEWQTLRSYQERLPFWEAAAAQQELPKPTETEKPTGGSRPDNGRSTGRDAEVLAWLVKHHRYRSAGCGSCDNYEPLGLRTLARRSGLSRSQVQRAFGRLFGGWQRYEACCMSGRLVDRLRRLV